MTAGGTVTSVGGGGIAVAQVLLKGAVAVKDTIRKQLEDGKGKRYLLGCNERGQTTKKKRRRTRVFVRTLS